MQTRALANSTPIHHWKAGELKLGRKCYFFGEMNFTLFLMALQKKTPDGTLEGKALMKKVPLGILGLGRILGPNRVLEVAN